MGSIGEALFGDGGADAAGKAALAQQREAKRQFADLERRTEAPTLEAMMNFEKGIQAQERNLSRQEQLVSQIDPTVIEASQQALRLLRGESASTLAPIQRQRQQQRQKLLNSLREQLGPGAETSTAGIQALTRFDSETDSLMAGAQQQALGNLGGLAQQFSSTRPDLLREAAGLGQLGAGRAGLASNQAQMLYNAGQSLVSNAGAPFVADAIRGQQRAAFGQALLGGAMGAISGGIGGAVSSGLGSLGSSFMGLFKGGGGGGSSSPAASNFGGFGSTLLPTSTGGSYTSFGGMA